jgi:hypothetical protein
MNNQKKDNSNLTKLAIVSLTTSLLGILSFFLMFNWAHGEFLIVPTLLFGFTCLFTGIIGTKQMITSRKKGLAATNASMVGFGIIVGVCILVFFCVALITHSVG